MFELSIRDDGQIILIGENHWRELFQIFLYFEDGKWSFETYDRFLTHIMSSGNVRMLEC